MELEDSPRKCLVVVRGSEHELRLLHVEHAPLEHRRSGWAENTGQPASQQRGRDDLEMLDEAVVEGEQARVVRPRVTAHVVESYDGVVRRDVVQLRVELRGRARMHARAVAHVVIHHDGERDQSSRSKTATNAELYARPSGERSSARCQTSANRL